MTLSTAEDAYAALEAVVAENPDYVYTSRQHWIHTPPRHPYDPAIDTECYNIETDPETGHLVPSCLIGQALVRAGEVTVQWFVEHHAEGHSATGLAGMLRWPNEVRTVLAQAQCAQDTGESWGQALQRAHEALVEIQERR